MSLLKKSAPALLYTGIAAMAFGAAVFSAVHHGEDARKNQSVSKDCEMIVNGKKPAALLQQLGCTMRHGYHFGKF